MEVSLPGDPRSDPALAELTSVDVVVVAAVGERLPRAAAGASAASADRRYCVDQRDKLRDVVAVAAVEAHRQRNPAGVTGALPGTGRAPLLSSGRVAPYRSPSASAGWCPSYSTRAAVISRPERACGLSMFGVGCRQGVGGGPVTVTP
jgi:hypothetical protein